jgi:hypothetical protein
MVDLELSHPVHHFRVDQYPHISQVLYQFDHIQIIVDPCVSLVVKLRQLL